MKREEASKRLNEILTEATEFKTSEPYSFPMLIAMYAIGATIFIGALWTLQVCYQSFNHSLSSLSCGSYVLGNGIHAIISVK
jgi:hypothetical protein